MFKPFQLIFLFLFSQKHDILRLILKAAKILPEKDYPKKKYYIIKITNLTYERSHLGKRQTNAGTVSIIVFFFKALTGTLTCPFIFFFSPEQIKNYK